VLEIEGKPARAWLSERVTFLRDTMGFSTEHGALFAACHQGLADWEGTSISFSLQGGSDRKKVNLTRNGGPNFVPIGPVFPPEGLKETGRQTYGKTAGGFGYIHLRDIPDELPTQMDEMLEAIGDVPGLVLDMRANGGGGCDHEAVLGRFVADGKTWRQYKGQGKRPFTGPVVVIVDAGCVSAGETIAGSFKEDGRGYMIGDGPTAGMSSQKETVTVPSGLLTIRFSVASNKGRFNGGKGIEGIGVPPHEVVLYDSAELLKGVDSQIRRAEELLAKGFPKGTVPYEPPDRR
jgi:carboxyl-terminal processing protease